MKASFKFESYALQHGQPQPPFVSLVPSEHQSSATYYNLDKHLQELRRIATEPEPIPTNYTL